MGDQGSLPVRWPTQEQGIALLEVVAALGLLAAVVVFFISALTTHSMATRSVDANDQALNLTRTQLEDIKNATYNTQNCYPVTVTAPTGYTVSVTVQVPSANLQLITVSTARGGTTFLSVDIYKANVYGESVSQSC